MSNLTLVLNPYAGKGAGRGLRGRIVEKIRSRTSDFELIETTRPREGTEIARNTSSHVVVAVGGDGTVHEVANGILGSGKVLGVLPIGSGNDFVKSIGIPSSLDDSISALISGRTALIDVGMVEIEKSADDLNPVHGGKSCFVNGLGIGFDAAVAIRTQQFRFVSGTLVYVLAVLQTLGRYVPPEFKVSVDQRVSNSRNLLVAIGNGRCAGGGFYLTPEAKVADGQLDLCIVEAISTMAILRLMPLVMKGKHHNVHGVRFERGECITVEASNPTAVHADGEILGGRISRLGVRVVPRAMSVIVGPSYS